MNASLGVTSLALLLACTPAPTPTQTPAPTPTPAPTQTSTRANVDARIEFEEGPDPEYGAGETSVRGVLVIPALSLRRKLFAVPFPYTCRRGESDAGDDLVVECLGDDGLAYARLRAEPGHVIVEARDYGRISAHKTVDDVALPAGVTVTVFAPLKYPSTR